MRSKGGNPAKVAWLVIAGLLVFMVAFAAGCGSSDDSTTAGQSDALTEVGKGEGELNLIAWAGYVEDGSTDPKVDWVTDFEKETGCQVNVKVAGTSDEMVELMRSGQYDGVSASGNATARLVDGGDVAPVNTDLVPNYADRLRRPQGPAVQHLRRRQLRHPARSRGEPADVEHGRRIRTSTARPGRRSSIRRSRPSTRARSASTTTRSTSPTRRCT